MYLLLGSIISYTFPYFLAFPFSVFMIFDYISARGCPLSLETNFHYKPLVSAYIEDGIILKEEVLPFDSHKPALIL